MVRRKRVLFFAEAVTLAHVARPLALAAALDPASYEVTLACSPRQARFLAGTSFKTVGLNTVASAQFLDALRKGSPVYDLETLRRYLRDDLAIIDAAKPDLIVGDFRLSLSASARLAGVPYAGITNAYWSPWYLGERFALPVLPMTRWLPLPFARALFMAAGPVVFPLHCRPLNRLRTENGLPALGDDLRRVYTDADHVLYADPPGLFPLAAELPSTHRCLGSVLWSPPVAQPPWWDAVPTDKPRVYVTLGSSGAVEALQAVVDGLSTEPVSVMASTAGQALRRPAANVFVADYLPGTEAAARANLVICNGGSPTSQQALTAGVPVLGIAGNMDQFLNMKALVAAGVGVLVRADRFDAQRIRRVTRELLETPSWDRNARQLAARASAHSSCRNFASFVDQTVGS